MPELQAVGRIADSEQIDTEPVIVPIVAYTANREEVVEKFPFRAIIPPGVMAFIERNPQTMGVNNTLVVLQDLLVEDARERWSEFLNREDLFIEAQTLLDLFASLLEHYGERPTRPWSGSSRTAKRSGRTSKAAPRSTE